MCEESAAVAVAPSVDERREKLTEQVAADRRETEPRWGGGLIISSGGEAQA